MPVNASQCRFVRYAAVFNADWCRSVPVPTITAEHPPSTHRPSRAATVGNDLSLPSPWGEPRTQEDSEARSRLRGPAIAWSGYLRYTWNVPGTDLSATDLHGGPGSLSACAALVLKSRAHVRTVVRSDTQRGSTQDHPAASARPPQGLLVIEGSFEVSARRS